MTEFERVRLTQERVRQWAADHKVGFPSPSSGEPTIGADAGQDFEDFWEGYVATLECVPVETLRRGVEQFIETQAMLVWLEESLDEDGTMPRHVLAEVADRVPRFRDGCDEYHRLHPNQELDYGTVLLDCNDSFRSSPNAGAIASLAMLDTRFLRLGAYTADRSRRSRMKTHPPFDAWYSTVLEYPLTGDTPAVYDRYRRSMLDRLLDALGQVSEAPTREGDHWFSAVRWLLHGALNTRADGPTTFEPPSETTNDARPTTSVPAPTDASGSPAGTLRQRVDACLAKVFDETGLRLRYADFWRVARYRDRTTFHYWVSSDLVVEHPRRKVGKTVAANFERVLRMPPAEFAAEAKRARARLKRPKLQG